jgi:plasmid maintenance system antidote protein VapI
MNISASKIDIFLAKRGMTKAELAEGIGLHRQNISTILRRGTCEPRTAGKLAAGLGVSVEEIIAKEA